MNGPPAIEAFFHERTSTLTYLVHRDGVGVVIDPVLDYEPRGAEVSHVSAEGVAAAIDATGLRIPFVLDTHAHADHLSAVSYFRERYAARTVIGRHIGEVQAVFRDLYNLGADFPVDGSQFDVLLGDGERLDVGPFVLEALHTPGHTPACMSYRIEDAVFVGDTLFQPDYGTARCDFPGGSAPVLWDSIQRLYALPEETRIFTCHDYRPGGRDLAYESTVAEQRRANVQVDAKTSRDDFVAFRRARDAQLALPELILPSVQVNVRAGQLPEPEANGTSYLRLPINRMGHTG
jgi:glyoxylase-like metal-dependent hydrolase (beta-lactamase superfamily II)